MKVSNRTKLSGALIAGMGLALAVPASQAVGLSSPPSPTIRVVSPGKIADRGAVAFVTVRVACPAGEQQSASLQLTERSGNGVAQGFGSAPVSCTGNFQRVTITMTANTKPFVPGNAFAQAQLFAECAFPGFPCPTPAEDSKSITLKR